MIARPEMPTTIAGLGRALRANVRLPIDASRNLGTDMLQSGEVRARRIGADLLGYAGDREHRPKVRRSVASTLTAALENETDPGVIIALLRAIGNTAYAPAATAAARFAKHPSARVREASAFAIFGCLDRSRRAIPALIQLSSDRSEGVRDWATTGLRASVQLWGRRDRDVIEALARRIEDPSDSVNGEAMVGLAAAGDGRAKTALERQISRGKIDLYMLETAQELGVSQLASDLESKLISIWLT